jgi:hypothetical protein
MVSREQRDPKLAARLTDPEAQPLEFVAEGNKKAFNLLNTLEIHSGLLEKATGGVAIV